MELEPLRRFADEALLNFGLHEKGWRFRFDRARVRFGACNYTDKVISISAALAQMNDDDQCRDTVLHEIAHALAGRKAGHGPRWKTICLRIGARPERCYKADEVQRPSAKYIAKCPSCDRQVPFYRAPRVVRACGPCCRKHAGGAFDRRFILILHEVDR